MNRYLSTALLVLAATTAAPSYSADLIVNVTGVRAHKGMLKLAVYDSAASWDGDGKALAADQQTPFMGMPTEGYGFSNNPKVMRKAHFDEAAVAVGETPVTITLKLR